MFKNYNSNTSVFISNISENCFTPDLNTLKMKDYKGQKSDTYLNTISDYLQYLYDIDCEDVKLHLGVVQNKLNRMHNVINNSVTVIVK